MNLFNKVRDWLANSPVVILIFFAALAMLFIGIVHFCEDTYSTYAGIKMLERLYSIKPATWGITYWTMALSFSVGQVIALYLFLVDTEKHKLAVFGYVLLCVADLVTDWYYRSNGFVKHVPGNFVGSLAITVVFYTLFSEIFVTMGFALAAELLVPAIVEWKKFRKEIGAAIHKAKDFIAAANKVRAPLSGKVFANRFDFGEKDDIFDYRPPATSVSTLAQKHHPAAQTRRIGGNSSYQETRHG